MIGKSLRQQHGGSTSSEIIDFDFSMYACKGHSSQLGHYFRHLFHMTKFVVNHTHKNLDYKRKLGYLRILRAQLSNQEQALLFYNWIAVGFGAAWENNKNKFFTDYCLIHNLWYTNLIELEYISEQIQKLKAVKSPLRKGNLFEIDD